MMFAIHQAQERLERLEQAIGAAVPDWSLAKVVTALMALRGIDLMSSTGFLAEVGDLSRFPTTPEPHGISRHRVFGAFSRRYDRAWSHHEIR
jgi:transposase